LQVSAQALLLVLLSASLINNAQAAPKGTPLNQQEREDTQPGQMRDTLDGGLGTRDRNECFEKVVSNQNKGNPACKADARCAELRKVGTFAFNMPTLTAPITCYILMSSIPTDHDDRVRRAKLGLNGLSLGDAFGERFFDSDATIAALLKKRTLPRYPWHYTDDTVMALAIFEVLERRGYIDQDLLARAFAAKYLADTNRGYGPGAHRILRELAKDADWREISASAFGGSGSLGNGGAMRAAPVGAYFSDDLERAAEEARRSAVITHAHPEGQAGAIAVAVAAACCARGEAEAQGLIGYAIEHTPDGDTRVGLRRAEQLDLNLPVEEAVNILGNGSKVTAPDTVPFTLWCARRHIGRFEEAMWQTVSGLGDRDTTCAIVGGIVALTDEGRSIPPQWYEYREPLSRLGKLGLDG
jgi:ADP-ribosylglycohydrolase